MLHEFICSNNTDAKGLPNLMWAPIKWHTDTAFSFCWWPRPPVIALLQTDYVVSGMDSLGAVVIY